MGAERVPRGGGERGALAAWPGIPRDGLLVTNKAA